MICGWGSVPFVPGLGNTLTAGCATALPAQASHADAIASATTSPLLIDASHALSRMAYIRRTAPQTFAQTRYVLLPKDYCVLQLTGAVASDMVSAVGLVGRRGYVLRLLDLVPGATERLPELIPSRMWRGA